MNFTCSTRMQSGRKTVEWICSVHFFRDVQVWKTLNMYNATFTRGNRRLCVDHREIYNISDDTNDSSDAQEEEDDYDNERDDDNDYDYSDSEYNSDNQGDGDNSNNSWLFAIIMK